METTFRTTVRGIIWRIIVFLTSMVLSFSLTGNFSAAIGVAILEGIIKIFIYVKYEQLFFKKFHWGKDSDGKDSVKRTLLKGLVWRSLATCVSMVLVISLTGNSQAAGLFGMIAFPLKLSLYIAYEQLIWKKINWGLICEKPLSNIVLQPVETNENSLIEM
jgi:uncharacterized membrane protein